MSTIVTTLTRSTTSAPNPKDVAGTAVTVAVNSAAPLPSQLLDKNTSSGTFSSDVALASVTQVDVSLQDLDVEGNNVGAAVTKSFSAPFTGGGTGGGPFDFFPVTGVSITVS